MTMTRQVRIALLLAAALGLAVAPLGAGPAYREFGSAWTTAKLGDGSREECVSWSRNWRVSYVLPTPAIPEGGAGATTMLSALRVIYILAGKYAPERVGHGPWIAGEGSWPGGTARNLQDGVDGEYQWELANPPNGTGGTDTRLLTRTPSTGHSMEKLYAFRVYLFDTVYGSSADTYALGGGSSDGQPPEDEWVELPIATSASHDELLAIDVSEVVHFAALPARLGTDLDSPTDYGRWGSRRYERVVIAWWARQGRHTDISSGGWMVHELAGYGTDLDRALARTNECAYRGNALPYTAGRTVQIDPRGTQPAPRP